MDSPPSTTSNAVLGLLALRPWTTYELAKQVQRSLGWFWPRAERKLYDEPKRLVKDGLATATAEMTGARPRTVYAITRRGRTALRRWLDEPPAPPTLEFEGMVKVFFADGGNLDQLGRTLSVIADAADERVADLEGKVAQHLSGEAPFPERLHINSLGLRFVLDHERLISTWARWAQAQSATWQSTTDPGRWRPEHAFETGQGAYGYAEPRN